MKSSIINNHIVKIHICKDRIYWEKVYICTRIYGALAHLARALDWQSKGDRFESDMLHESKSLNTAFVLGVQAFFDYEKRKRITGFCRFFRENLCKIMLFSM